MSYWKFLKHSSRMAFPMQHDFWELGSAVARIGEFLAVVVVRFLILVTLPISAPLMALVWSKMEKKRIERLQDEHKELVESLMGLTQKE